MKVEPKKFKPELCTFNGDKMNYAQLRKLDISNGSGIRVTLFVSGCTRNCKNCFNKEYQSFDYGNNFSKETLDEIIEEIEKDYCKGLTLLGGEPFENLELIEYLEPVRNKIDTLNKESLEKKDIWIYSGFTFEEILKDEKKKKLLSFCDIFVDGPFIDRLKDLRLKFRGSSNQRILDVKKSLDAKKAIIYSDIF